MTMREICTSFPGEGSIQLRALFCHYMMNIMKQRSGMRFTIKYVTRC